MYKNLHLLMGCLIQERRHLKKTQVGTVLQVQHCQFMIQTILWQANHKNYEQWQFIFEMVGSVEVIRDWVKYGFEIFQYICPFKGVNEYLLPTITLIVKIQL